MAKRIFVTGAAGVIGWELAKKLADQGHEVLALSRRDPKGLVHPGVRWVLADLMDYDALRAAMRGCHEVYHVAAITRLHTRYAEEMFANNVRGTEHVMKAAGANGVSRVCYTSTGGVLGPNNGQPLTERDYHPGPFDNNYDLSKYMAEQQVHHYVKRGQDAVIVNVSRLFGPAQMRFSNAITKMIGNYMTKPFVMLPGDGHAIGNYAYITDVVNGHILAMEHGISDERYILGGHNLSYHQLLDEVAALTGRHCRRIAVPRTAMKVFARMETARSTLLGKAPRITASDIDRLCKSRALSLEKSVSAINYAVTPVAKAVAETVAFLGFDVKQQEEKQASLFIQQKTH